MQGASSPKTETGLEQGMEHRKLASSEGEQNSVHAQSKPIGLVVTPLSKDHKPGLDGEKARIEKAGHERRGGTL